MGPWSSAAIAQDGQMTELTGNVNPGGLLALGDGSVLISERGHAVIRHAPDGTETDFAGQENATGFSGDGGPATQALLAPGPLSLAADGSVLIGDVDNSRVRRVAPDGTISTVAGFGYFEEGCPATQVALDGAPALAALPDGGFLLSQGSQIDRVWPDGTLTRVAGTGAEAPPGDGGPAILAGIAAADISMTSDGGYLVVDGANRTIRRVSPSGTITTVAGSPTASSEGDGGPATAARLVGPAGVAATSDGGFLIADEGDNRIRRVAPDGTISTFAGTGQPGADWMGPATQVRLYAPTTLAVGFDGSVYIGDYGNQRVMKVTSSLRPAQAAASPAGSSGDIDPSTTGCRFLDSTFGTLGLGVYGSSYDSQVVAEPDGSLVTAGAYPNAGVTVRRIKPDGSLDSGFGSGGSVSLPGGYAPGLVRQPDGKLIVGGAGSVPSSGAGVLLTRLNPDGTIDRGFGTDGQVAYSFTRGDRTGAIGLQPDGKIVVATYAEDNSPWYLVRLNPDGSVDRSFGPNGNGTVKQPLGSDTTFNTLNGPDYAMRVASDGSIVIAGVPYVDAGPARFAVARFTRNGLLDPSFGNYHGIAVTTQPGWASSLALTGDGHVLVGGYVQTGPAKVVELTPRGGPEPNFGQAGVTTIQPALDREGHGSDGLHALTVQPNGEILAAGDGGGFGLWRLCPNGAPDPSFGVDGHVVTRLSDNANASAVAIGTDGEPVSVGPYWEPGLGFHLAVLHYSMDAASRDLSPSCGDSGSTGGSSGTPGTPSTLGGGPGALVTSGQPSAAGAGNSPSHSPQVTASSSATNSGSGGAPPSGESGPQPPPHHGGAQRSTGAPRKHGVLTGTCRSASHPKPGLRRSKRTRGPRCRLHHGRARSKWRRTSRIGGSRRRPGTNAPAMAGTTGG